MKFDSLAFAVFCSAAITLLTMIRQPKPRALVVLALNAIFLASFVGTPVHALPLLGFVAVGYGAIVLSSTVGASLSLITAVIVLFTWLRKYDVVAFLPQIDSPYLVVGLSYILFRVIHLIVDVGEKTIKRPDFLSYLAYVLFFPSFVSGPIQRYQDFRPTLETPALPATARDVHACFHRIIRGLFLVAVVTTLTFKFLSEAQTRLGDALAASAFSPSIIVLLCVATTLFTIHLYLNFAGYMDIVIGVGGLCGFRLPENFDHPYLAVNFLEFWSRWHITLSEWFKFYLFNPLLRVLSERWGTPAAMPYLGAAAFFATFVMMGIWHGSTRIFLVYGLFLGMGVVANKLYQIKITARLGKKAYKTLSARGWYRNLCRGATQAYFIVGVTCVWVNQEMAAWLLRPQGLGAIIIAFFILTAMIAATSAILEFGLARLRAPSLPAAPLADWMMPVWTAAKLFVLVNAILVLDWSTPEFVYKGF